MGLPTMLLLVASVAEAQFNPWVSEASITGDSQFAIYDRDAQALVVNPVFQHPNHPGEAVSRSAGVVNGTSVTVTVDLNGEVDITDPILVRVRPAGRIGKTEIPLDPPEIIAEVVQWSDPDNLSFSLSAPVGVGRNELDITWSIETSTDGGETWWTEQSDVSWHILYTTYSMPIVSQTYLGQRPERGNPWIDMLERSTVWAAGLTDDDEIMQALTVAFWANSEHIYDGGQHSTYPLFNEIDVERFLNPEIDIQADCRDMSNFLALLGRSLGLNVTTFRIRGGVSGGGFFYTQYLGPHGGRQPAVIYRPGPIRIYTTDPIHDWTQTAWNYHQVAFYNGKIYDACAKIEFSPFVPRNPSNILNHRDLSEEEATALGYEYIPDGDYVPNDEGFLLSSSYDAYQPYLVLNESPFISFSHIEQQGAAPVVR